MITPCRLVILLVLLCPFFAATLAAEKSDLSPGAKSEAVRQLDAILDRIRDEVRKSNDVQKLYGVERDKSNDDASDVTSISVAPSYEDSVGDSVSDASSSFSDKDLACLVPLKGITRLVICRSKITNAGLRHLAGLQRLEYLDLSENAITDDGLRSLANLTALKNLNLSKTKVTGTGLAHLARLNELRVLNLDESPVNREGIASLPDLPLLEQLSAVRTRMDGAGIAAFRHTPNLTTLDLRDTSVDDAGLVHLRGLSQLRTLRLSGAPVRGQGLLHLGSLTQLEQLDCRPIWSKELAAVLARWKKLRTLDLQVPDPTTVSPSERAIELYGMESLADLRVHCPRGAESIELRDMPGLRAVRIESSPWIDRRIGKPQPRIGQIRIRGVKTLDTLIIPMPERLVLSDLARIDDFFVLHGVLKTDALRVLRELEFREVSLHASPGSEPSVLSVFAPTFRATRRGGPRLWLGLDAMNADWLDALRGLSTSPNEIRIETRTFDRGERLDLAKLEGLRLLSIRTTTPVTLPRLVLVGPKTLRDLSLDGFQTEELHCKGWFPSSLRLESARRIIVSDPAEATRVSIPGWDNLREFEIHNAPKLITLWGPSTESRLEKLAVHNAPKLQTLDFQYSPMLSSLKLGGPFPDLRYVEVGGSALDDAFLTQLAVTPSLKVLAIVRCKNLSDEAIASFRKAHPKVEVRAQ